MRIAHVSTSASRGGAARAAYRVHEGLLAYGVDSHFVVQELGDRSKNVHHPHGPLQRLRANLARRIERLRLPDRRNQSVLFSPAWFPDDVPKRVRQLRPDLVNLHWINLGFMRLESLRELHCPIVWTLHDMWPLTGGCHYSGRCRRYELQCGECPQLGSCKEHDLSRQVWERKSAAWKDLEMHVVAPSKWMADCARASSLFATTPVTVIPYGFDLNVFRPVAKSLARRAFDLPDSKSIILFGAFGGSSDPRKGFDLLRKSLEYLRCDGGGGFQEDLQLVVFGESEARSESMFGLETRYVPMVTDDSQLALLYAAADVFVAPSREDNLPNTVIEAMACGTPCVAFNIGGMPDMIIHAETGYLATPNDPSDLARGITYVLAGSTRTEVRARNRSVTLQHFSLSRQAEEYAMLYKRILSGRRSV